MTIPVAFEACWRRPLDDGAGHFHAEGPGRPARAGGEAPFGVDVARLKRRVVVGTALAVGPGVAVAGFIGFVGLLVPHALRALLGARPRLLLPHSALGGALVTLVADIGCRLVQANGELKLGIVTALLGAPFFLYLLTRERGVGA